MPTDTQEHAADLADLEWDLDEWTKQAESLRRTIERAQRDLTGVQETIDDLQEKISYLKESH